MVYASKISLPHKGRDHGNTSHLGGSDRHMDWVSLWTPKDSQDNRIKMRKRSRSRRRPGKQSASR